MRNNEFVKNAIKFYFAALTYNTNAKTIKINLSTPQKVADSYKSFLQNGGWLIKPLAERFKALTTIIKGDGNDSFRLTDVDKFEEFFMNPDVVDMLKDKTIVGYSTTKIEVVPPKGGVSEKMFSKAVNHFTEVKKSIPELDTNYYWCDDESDLSGLIQLQNGLKNPENIKFYWACRNADGNGPVLFVQCATYDSETGRPIWESDERHHVRAIYARLTRTKYYDARECSYDYWDNNPDDRFKIAKRYNQF